MPEPVINDPELEKFAIWFAANTPILRDPVSPPLKWRLEGDVLRVLMADGRTFRKPLVEIKEAMKPAEKPVKLHPAVVEVTPESVEFPKRRK
jgi:hypothetical protein